MLLKLPPILSKYLAASFFKTFLMLSGSFMGIVFIGTFLEKFKTYTSVGIWKGLGLIMMELPEFIHPIIPLCIVIATMMTIWKFTRSSELVIIRSTGLSVWKFMAPLMIVTFLIGCFDVMVINPASIALNKQQEVLNYRYGLSTSSPFSLSEKGFWLKEKTDNEDYVIIYAENVKQKENKLFLQNPIIYFLDDNHQFEKRIESTNGQLYEHTFHFKNATEIIPGEKIKEMDMFELNTSLSLDKIHETLSSSDQHSFWELPALIHFFNKTGFSTRRIWEQFMNLLIFPFFAMVFVLMGGAFSLTTQPRSAKFFFRIASGTGAGFVIYFADHIVRAMASSGSMPVLLGVLTIPLLVTFIGTAFLLHLEDG